MIQRYKFYLEPKNIPPGLSDEPLYNCIYFKLLCGILVFYAKWWRIDGCAGACADIQKSLASCDARLLSGEDEIRTRGRIAPTSV